MKFKKFYQESVRVFKVTKKPNWIEFKRVFQVTGLGVLLVGLIGFMVIILYRIVG